MNQEENMIIRCLSSLSSFERDVLLATLNVPKGKVTTYKRIAIRIGRPKACRAVGNALHRNPLPRTIPCHRVVRSDGIIAGDPEEVSFRRRLLEQEGIPVVGNRVKISEKILY
ncbi:MAG: MGMT family protein [Nitrososphaerota archaeon]|nr:MGMT family protein [Candidatus Bathyarchaeota archaeon]MDW8049422.1 MGMT family protein [Nitrososphaerota archaeon]